MDNNVVAKHILDVAAKIKLDKGDKKELMVELGDIFENASTLDLNSKENIESLKDLAKAFEAIFTKAGKSFDLEKLIKMPPPAMFAEMGKMAATSFWDAWNSISKGMGGNATQEMMREQFKQLEKQKTNLLKRKKELPKKLREYEELSPVVEDFPYMEENVFKAFTKEEIQKMEKQMNASIEEIADKMQESLRRATTKLSKMSLEDSEYDASLEEVVKRAQDVFRMSRTIEKNPGLIKNEEIAEGYDFSYLQDDYSDFLENLSVRFDGIIKNLHNELAGVSADLQKIDVQLTGLKDSGIEIVDQTEARNGLKAINEIKEAYQRLSKYADQNKKSISAALNYEPKQDDGIRAFRNAYRKVENSEDWVEEYKALVKYVKLYESYLNSSDPKQRDTVSKPGNEFTKLYYDLKPMYENARNMLQSVINGIDGKPPVGIGGTGGDGAGSGPTPEDVANAQRLREEAEAKAEAEQKQAQAEKEKAKALKQQRIEEEKIAAASEKKKLADESVKSSKLYTDLQSESTKAFEQQIAVTNGASNIKESMRLIGKDGLLSVVEGDDYAVDVATMVDQLVANLKNNIIMSLHDHPNAIDAFTPSDVDSFAKLYYDQGIKINGIIANGVIKTIDFTGISKDVAIKIGEKFSDNLSKVAEQTGFFSYKDGNIIPTPETNELAESDPEKYQVIMDTIIESVNVALDEAFKQNGLESTVKTFSAKQLPELTQYLLDIQKSGEGAVPPVEKLKNLIMSIKPGQMFEWENYADILKRFEDGAIDGTDAINQINALLDGSQSTNQSVLVQKYNQASDAVKQLTDKLVYLDQQMQTLDERTSAVNMDGFDQWNPTDEQKTHIVKTLEEYQSIIKQIADFPIVQTDDDKKRLIELKEEALKLANTLKLAYRSDSNPDSYIKEYGVSREQARIFMDIQNESSKLRTEIRNELNSEFGTTFAKIQETDKEFARTILDNADNLNQLVNGITAVEHAVDGLNESLEKTQQLTSGDGTGAGTGDASLVDLEAERAKAEALQDELDHRIGALQAAHDEKEMLQSDLNIANEQIKIAQDSEIAARARADETDLKLIEKEKHIQTLEEQLAQAQISDGDALFAAEQRAKEAEEKASRLERKLAESSDGAKKQGIEINESTLEATLTKVFANILNPQTQQNDSEQGRKPWAREDTLKTVKGVLDNIQTNTGKIGTIVPSNVDTIAGTALDGRLTEIKSVLESIEKKIVDGGKIFNRGGAKQAYQESQKDSGSTKAARSNMMKSIINDYKTLGKLSAQFASEENLETKAMLENLKAEIARKRKSLKLTMDESASLREKYSIAFDAEKRLLDAAKAQKEIDKQTKQKDKDSKADWKKKVKEAQRATGINAATTAANAGDQTVVRAIGTEGISKDIENKAKELSDQIEALRVLRDEIDKKGNKASDEDRENLSKQISKVKELKTEVDGYLKIHEKYSGDNAKDLGDGSDFGAVGTDEYWNNITAAIKSAASGKTTIKGLNADTGELTGTTRIAANTFAEWSATVDPLTGRLKILRTGIKKTETIIETITRKTKEIFTYFSGSSIIFKAFNELKKGIQYVREIDLALTELKKVTDETEETYDRFLKTAAKTGARLGTTISAVTEATATFAKLGYTLSEATEMAEAAIVYKNVGDNIASTEDAADSIISTMKGFKLEATESMKIVDRFNEVGKSIAHVIQ